MDKNLKELDDLFNKLYEDYQSLVFNYGLEFKEKELEEINIKYDVLMNKIKGE
jgi:hypothetical protein|tara:strand:- start:993 stop:1151 length:159 start_codon:yes stop_codon:yes gene_type:complete